MPPALLGARILAIVVGLLALLAGRRLFWVFVGAAGFLAGFGLAADLLQGAAPLLILIIAVAGGLVGALLATVFQKVAVFVAGVIAGGMLALSLLRGLGLDVRPLLGVGFLAGAIIGAVLNILLFEWALIGLSSIAGATLIVRALDVRPPLSLLVLLGLVVVGIVVQATTFREDVKVDQPTS